MEDNKEIIEEEKGAEMSPETKSPKEIMIARIKGAYPDEDIDDDNMMDFANKHWDDFKKKHEDLENKVKGYTDLIMGNEHASNFISSMAKGQDPIEYLLDAYGEDFRNALEDPEVAKKLQEKKQAKEESEAEDKTRGEEFSKNLEESFAKVDAFQKEKGLTDEEAKNIVEKIAETADNAVMGIFDEGSIESAFKALNYDKDMQSKEEEKKQAEEIGRVAGRNEKIASTLKKNSKGLPPQLGGQGGSPAEKKKIRYPDPFSAGGFSEKEI